MLQTDEPTVSGELVLHPTHLGGDCPRRSRLVVTFRSPWLMLPGEEPQRQDRGMPRKSQTSSKRPGAEAGMQAGQSQSASRTESKGRRSSDKPAQKNGEIFFGIV